MAESTEGRVRTRLRGALVGRVPFRPCLDQRLDSGRGPRPGGLSAPVGPPRPTRLGSAGIAVAPRDRRAVSPPIGFGRFDAGCSPSPRPEAFDTAVQARWLDVCAAMATLSPLERTALVMTAVEGATYEEAGVVLGTRSRGPSRGGQSRPNEVGGRLMEALAVNRILEGLGRGGESGAPVRPRRRRRVVRAKRGLSSGMLAGAKLLWLPRSWSAPCCSAGLDDDPGVGSNLTAIAAPKKNERQSDARSRHRRRHPLVTPTPTPLATPTPRSPTLGPCHPSDLEARITQWEGRGPPYRPRRPGQCRLVWICILRDDGETTARGWLAARSSSTVRPRTVGLPHPTPGVACDEPRPRPGTTRPDTRRCR